MDVSQWATLSVEAQQKRIKRFLTDTGKAKSSIVVSTDGTRTAQKTPPRENAQSAQELLPLKGDCQSVGQMKFKNYMQTASF